jgi:hypothetical protein
LELACRIFATQQSMPPNVRTGSMVSKKSKIEQLSKSRERPCLPAAASASVCRTRTKLCGRLLVIRRGPSYRRAQHAPAVLKNLVHLPEKFFDSIGQKPTGPLWLVGPLIP